MTDESTPTDPEQSDEAPQLIAAQRNLIYMVGTDHTIAPADVREAFTLQADDRPRALALARDLLGASGVAIISTCNRTELWASFDNVEAPKALMEEDGTPSEDDPFLSALCQAHGLDASAYTHYATIRSDEDAVEHLFNVACGLKSAIMAEDQIISQVKHAIAYSREQGLADSCLEVLFRQAVTASKHVKSGVRFTRAYTTAVEQALGVLDERGVDLSKATCMVIGNGEYGKLAASTLAGRGARVFVTVRQYTHGYVSIPEGCGSIPYADRYKALDTCDIVMSATTSPHFTLVRSDFEEHHQGSTFVFDLAIPRDADPGIAEIEGCELFGIDDFSTEIGTENTQAIAEAEEILEEGMGEFWSWIARRTSAKSGPEEGAFFPLFVNLNSKHALFVGGGTIALRRIRTLLPFVGSVDVVAPEVTPEVQTMADTGAVNLRLQAYAPECLEGADIVFACTNDACLNAEIAHLCHEQGRMVSVSSDRHLCDFYYPGVVQRDNIVVGISAGGKDHRRVRQLRGRIARLLEEEDI
ncbi:MAG: hypothetical protein IJ131_11365 [Eggerthellaceae bacterium]|nr:hypothetical protein [Eggerthellaceae bacterium]